MATIDNTMIKAIARAFRWQKLLENGTYGCLEEIARAEKIGASFVSRLMRLALLALDIVEAILAGQAACEPDIEGFDGAVSGGVERGRGPLGVSGWGMTCPRSHLKKAAPYRRRLPLTIAIGHRHPHGGQPNNVCGETAAVGLARSRRQINTICWTRYDHIARIIKPERRR
ncbi:MAG: hypothetical protein IPL11_19500 [Candidatus Accumulibacter sp.]|nr:hypothetical protein [Accumulibacter sp.]